MRWLVICLIAGCKSDPGPTCAEVTDHMLEVTKQQVIGHEGMVLGQRDAMIAQCNQREMPAETRRCLLAAKDLPALASCRAGAKVEPDPNEKPRRPVQSPAAGLPHGPPPPTHHPEVAPTSTP